MYKGHFYTAGVTGQKDADPDTHLVINFHFVPH